MPAQGSRATGLVEQRTVPEVLELGPGVWPFTVTDPAHGRNQAVSSKDCLGSDAGYAGKACTLRQTAAGDGQECERKQSAHRRQGAVPERLIPPACW